jgi:uncharacterized protein
VDVDALALRNSHRSDFGWPHVVDVDDLLRAGWHPQPFQQFVLKVHSRCNLECDYCYVYRSPDQGWRNQPARMSGSTVMQAATRVAEHVRIHGITEVNITLHGGEPLLVGSDHLEFVCATLRSKLPRGVELDLQVQTNGTLLDVAILEVLRRHDVRVGVSLDGVPLVHDARRGRTKGRGSHSLVTRGLELLREPRYRPLFAGLLCVIDLRADPAATYEHLVSHEPPVVDFLLPHANWSNPPRGKSPRTAAPHGEWLIAAFDRWYSAPKPETSVRLFEGIIRGLLGRPSRVESIGLSPACVVVVETDGSIEQVDALKSAYEGAAATGLDVHRDAFDPALLLPGFAARQVGLAALPETCQRCDVVDVCGGGYYPHRYHQPTGFYNPSVYCDDLTALIRHVQSRVRHDVAAAAPPMSA